MRIVRYIILVLCTVILAVSIQAVELALSDATADQSLNSIEQVLTVLDKQYVYPETANKMRQHVAQKITLGRYHSVSSNEVLIAKLQVDLRQASGDGHISLHLNKGPLDDKSHIAPLAKHDLSVEVNLELDGHRDKTIAYLRFNKFGDDAVKNKLVKAMAQISTTSSLIIDLRENGGGDPSLVAFLSSYFLQDNTNLWSIYDRDGNSIIKVNSVTDDTVSLNKYAGKVCILTSVKTYSAAEAFAYTLKHLGRACIIGEASGGGAHLVEMRRVNDEIDIRIPTARAYNPVTKSNWEGVGVKPDIQVSASQAKSVALEYFRRETNIVH